jgi:hypothetical protein
LLVGNRDQDGHDENSPAKGNKARTRGGEGVPSLRRFEADQIFESAVVLCSGKITLVVSRVSFSRLWVGK